jgi:hypothetical protein
MIHPSIRLLLWAITWKKFATISRPTILTVIAFLPFSPVFHEPPGNHTAGLGYYKLMFNIFVLNGSQKSRVHWDRNATGREGVWFFFPKYVARR